MKNGKMGTNQYTIKKLDVSSKQKQGLRQIIHTGSVSNSLALRARIILLRNKGKTPHEITAMLDCHRNSVRNWENRFIQEGLEGLYDKPKPGRPRSFSPGRQNNYSFDCLPGAIPMGTCRTNPLDNIDTSVCNQKGENYSTDKHDDDTAIFTRDGFETA